MVRAIVLADTHLPSRTRGLPHQLLADAARADLIFHLGDFTGTDVAEQLESYAPLVGVRGNNDSEEIRERFPSFQRLTVEGHHFVLLHGDIGGPTALAAARAVPGGDVILFGHSHQPRNEREGSRLLFNPGSPTFKRWSPFCSYGALDIGEEVSARVIRVP